MRTRFTILALAAVLALTGCGGDDEPKDSAGSGPDQSRVEGPTDPLTELAVPCAKFSAAAQKIVEAQKDIYTRSGGPEAVAELETELQGLKEGAPTDVRTALDDLVAGFRDAAELGRNAAAAAQLARIGERLADAGRTVRDYVVSKCDS